MLEIQEAVYGGAASSLRMQQPAGGDRYPAVFASGGPAALWVIFSTSFAVKEYTPGQVSREWTCYVIALIRFSSSPGGLVILRNLNISGLQFA